MGQLIIQDKGKVVENVLRLDAPSISFLTRYLEKFPVVVEPWYMAGEVKAIHKVLGGTILSEGVVQGRMNVPTVIGGEDFVCLLQPDRSAHQIEDLFDDEILSKLTVPGRIKVFVLAQTEKALERCAKSMQHMLWEPPVDPMEVVAEVDYYFMDRDGDLDSRTFMVTMPEVASLKAELYPGLDVDMLVEQFIKGDERVLILFGEPGVGKTALIRYVLMKAYLLGGKNTQAAVYVKSEDVLSTDTLWMSLIDREPHFVLLDDLDFALLPRTGERKNPFVSHFLSYSNGVFQPKEGTSKVIITTNQPLAEIDSALVRPGRCFDVLELRALSLEEGLELWTGLFGRDPELYTKKFWARKEVSQAELVSALEDIDREVSREYLREAARSVRSRYQTQKGEPSPRR